MLKLNFTFLHSLTIFVRNGDVAKWEAVVDSDVAVVGSESKMKLFFLLKHSVINDRYPDTANAGGGVDSHGTIRSIIIKSICNNNDVIR